MLHTDQKRLKLLERNEGQLKAHESCLDARAWSHNLEVRDHYIRDWMKSDMPISVVPTRALSRCLRIMTRTCRGRSAPRCHPNCKSKLVLECICNSSDAIKDCLKNEESFVKYFDEEEFETSHWPCERCLEALKSIKMLWKIITEKIFKIRIPESDDLKGACNKNVQSVAKIWERELVQQAFIIKKLLNSKFHEKQSIDWKSYTEYSNNKIMVDNLRFLVENNEDNEVTDEKFKTCSWKDKGTEIDPTLFAKKINKSTMVRVKSRKFDNDIGDIDLGGNNIYVNKLDYLQQLYNIQNDELNQLKTENKALKRQLKDITKNSSPSDFTKVCSDNSASVIPIPYEAFCDNEDGVRDIDSELLITVKHCQNKKFKQISMLQVLHKTNTYQILDENFDNANCCKKKQDPIQILSKVQNTFGAIVNRELTIANQKRYNSKEIEITASYQNVQASRAAASCSPVTSRSSLSRVFVSSTEANCSSPPGSKVIPFAK